MCIAKLSIWLYAAPPYYIKAEQTSYFALWQREVELELTSSLPKG